MNISLNKLLRFAIAIIIIQLFSHFTFTCYSQDSVQLQKSFDSLVTQDSLTIRDSLVHQDSLTNQGSEIFRTSTELFSYCKICHTIGGGTLIGPDLLGMTKRHSPEWLIDFIQSSDSLIESGDKEAIKLFLENDKIPMPNHDFSDSEVKNLIDFILEEERKFLADPNFLDNPYSNLPASNTWLFIIAMLLILWPIIDMIFTRLLNYRINVLFIVVGFVLSGKVLTEDAIALGRSPGYEPDQPIQFSHKVHAGENKIDCKYCHSGVMESRYAFIPSASTCLNCHNIIRKGANTGTEEIAKIHRAINDSIPIKWVRVHNLPDHVFFSHSQHVNVGKLDCNECHGEVAEMGRIQQVNDLSMGWCINCHRKKAVQFDNKYYTSYQQHEELKSKNYSKVTVDDIGGDECQKCHY